MLEKSESRKQTKCYQEAGRCDHFKGSKEEMAEEQTQVTTCSEKAACPYYFRINTSVALEGLVIKFS